MEITLSRRYRGPLTSANGGYTAGRLAAYVPAAEVEVTLRRPPPLECVLTIERTGGDVTLFDGAVVVAEARPAQAELDPPEPVDLDEAARARARHVPAASPEFGECFVCGTREDGDGLQIRVGPVPGREPLHAAPWTPGEVAPELVWAAIDCPGAYAVGAAGRGEVVLGRMTARVERVPEPGETCVVAAWPLGEDGRKLYAGTALYSGDGAVLALARQVWITPRGG